jgi:sulfite exporter TauE/SafE
VTPLVALAYAFALGLLHGVLPDEHTWPITFSYAIGGASGRAGLRAGFFFSLAFTIQRGLLSLLAYLALARFLEKAWVNGVVYILVGIAMWIAGAILITRGANQHSHLMGSADAEIHEVLGKAPAARAIPVHWTLIHGFIAGFGFEGLFLSVITVCLPHMSNAWMGILPGVMFGLGTMVVLLAMGMLFGSFLRWARGLSEAQVAQIGADTGARTLFWGGILFVIFGVFSLVGWTGGLPVDEGYLVITLFMLGVAIPAFIYSWRRVCAGRACEVPLDRAAAQSE